MIARLNTKDAHIPDSILETMDRRIHQRLDPYFREEREDETVIHIRIAEQKNKLYRVELTMDYKGYTLRTENHEREISLPALDKGIDVLERQMRKVRTRLSRDLRRKPEFAGESLEEEAEPMAKVVRTKRHATKSMSVEDAILEMELLGHNFYLFNNVETGRAATVYRRNDGDCGLIELDDL